MRYVTKQKYWLLTFDVLRFIGMASEGFGTGSEQASVANAVCCIHVWWRLPPMVGCNGRNLQDDAQDDQSKGQ